MARTSRTVFIALVLALGSPACNPHAGPGPAAQSSASSLSKPVSPAPRRADEMLLTEWSAHHIVPSPPADDYQFHRRASLDILGRLPSPEALRAFAADTDPQKHSKLIDGLLADPAYAAYWASYWEDILLKSDTRKNIVDRAAFRDWLVSQLQSNTPWSRMVHELIAAEGVNTPGGEVRERLLAAEESNSTNKLEDNTHVNGAVNWLIQYGRSPEDIAGATSRLFLGVQIQCAQCHDHKTENWTTHQFQSLAAAFTRVRSARTEQPERGMMRAVELVNAKKPRLGPKAPKELRAIAALEPKALDGTPLEGENPRRALADWITSPSNPYFAKAIVNRIWAYFLGRGFFEPVDDQRPSNSIDAPNILNELASDFIAHAFDLKHLIRTVATSAAYRRGSSDENALWSAFSPRPLPTDVLFNSIIHATGLSPVVDELAGEQAAAIRFRLRRGFHFAFDTDEQSKTTEYEGSISEVLLLQNGPLSQAAATAFKNTPFAELIASPKSDEEKIQILYWRTLSRPPRPEELARWKKFVSEAQEDGGGEDRGAQAGAPPKDPIARLRKRLGVVSRSPKDRAFEDMAWALLNSTEFVTNH